MQLLITQFSGAGLVPRRHRFEPRYVYDRLVEGSVALGWVIRVELRLCLSVPIHRSSTPIHQLPTPYNLCCWQHPLVNTHARSSYILHYFLTATREGDAHVAVLSLCVVQCELLKRSVDVQKLGTCTRENYCAIWCQEYGGARKLVMWQRQLWGSVRRPEVTYSNWKGSFSWGGKFIENKTKIWRRTKKFSV